MRRPNGEVGWSQLVSRPRKLEDGGSCGTVIEIDITERKAAEQVLAESEERYRRLFEMESDAIVLVDGETGRFIDANPSALKLYGYTRQEFLCLKQEDVSAEPEKTSRATTEGQTYVTNRNHRKKDGTIFRSRLVAVILIPKGARCVSPPSGTYGPKAIRGVTAQERGGTHRRPSYRACGKLELGLPKWTRRVVARGVPDLRDLTPGTFDHTFSSVSKLVHPADLPKLLKAHESHAQGQAFEPYEFRVIRPDGDVRVAPVFSAEIERDPPRTAHPCFRGGAGHYGAPACRIDPAGARGATAPLRGAQPGGRRHARSRHELPGGQPALDGGLPAGEPDP